MRQMFVTYLAFLASASLPPVSAWAQVMRAEQPGIVQKVAENPELSDQEKVDRVVNDSLMRNDDNKTAAALKQMELVIGDIERVTSLPPERLIMLKIAAKGAVDRSLDSLRVAQESRVREQTTGVGLEELEERLTALGEIQTANAAPQDSSAWTAYVSKVLQPNEMKAWTDAQAVRSSYRASALAGLLVSEMERKLHLSVEQTDKLEPLLKRAFEDYLPDMGNYIDRNSGIDFRLLMLVIQGVPPETRQGILTPAQEAHLQSLTGDLTGWWQSIQQAHHRRLGIGRPQGVQ